MAVRSASKGKLTMASVLAGFPRWHVGLPLTLIHQDIVHEVACFLA